MKNKLIIFDVDDVLYNEIDYVKSGFKEVAKTLENKYNVINAYNSLWRLFELSSKNVFNRFLDENNIEYSKEDVMELVKVYKNHFPDIRLSNDLIKVLIDLRKEYSLAIVSDGDYNSQKLKCESLQLEKYFDKIILTDEFGKDYWKPSIKPFELLSDEFNINYKDMWYIGDNPNKDFYISKYGINTIRYYNPLGVYFNDEYKDGIKENYLIKSYEEIIEIVK